MKKIILLSAVILTVYSCTTVKMSGRKQLNLVPNSQIFPASFAQYDQFIKEHKLSTDQKNTARVKAIGNNLINAVNKYYQKNGWSSDLRGYKWEVNLVEDPQLNAFCMPGGKIVYYTGLLKVTTTDAEIAAVMGHEISHALANHGSERMTMEYGQQIGSILTMLATSKASPENQQKWAAIYGYGSTLGVILPYSRTHESEADKMGQIIMAIAGYNPDAAANVWVKMQQLGGQQPPEILSTHPSHERRMNNLRKWAPEAKQIARQFGVTSFKN
ncbi:MAG: M48 family metallopeptidase [Chlorobi bacterium]|nr:M48 family metallopeptidase [Chlorobiota bacterium]